MTVLARVQFGDCDRVCRSFDGDRFVPLAEDRLLNRRSRLGGLGDREFLPILRKVKVELCRGSSTRDLPKDDICLDEVIGRGANGEGFR